MKKLVFCLFISTLFSSVYAEEGKNCSAKEVQDAVKKLSDTLPIKIENKISFDSVECTGNNLTLQYTLLEGEVPWDDLPIEMIQLFKDSMVKEMSKAACTNKEVLDFFKVFSGNAKAIFTTPKGKNFMDITLDRSECDKDK